MVLWKKGCLLLLQEEVHLTRYSYENTRHRQASEAPTWTFTLVLTQVQEKPCTHISTLFYREGKSETPEEKLSHLGMVRPHGQQALDRV